MVLANIYYSDAKAKCSRMLTLSSLSTFFSIQPRPSPPPLTVGVAYHTGETPTLPRLPDVTQLADMNWQLLFKVCDHVVLWVSARPGFPLLISSKHQVDEPPAVTTIVTKMPDPRHKGFRWCGGCLSLADVRTERTVCCCSASFFSFLLVSLFTSLEDKPTVFCLSLQ